MRFARGTVLAFLGVLAVALAACGEREQRATPQAAPDQELSGAVQPSEVVAEPAPAAPTGEAPEAAAAPVPAAEPAAAAPPTTIEFELYKAGFVVGVSGGRGTLHFQGKAYPLSIGGVSVGATAGVSKAELVGSVHDLHRVEDIEGTYSAVQAGLALGGGEKVTQLENARKVRLELRGKQIGIELALDLNGMQISLVR